jgi:hypothetical protein
MDSINPLIHIALVRAVGATAIYEVKQLKGIIPPLERAGNKLAHLKPSNDTERGELV